MKNKKNVQLLYPMLYLSLLALATSLVLAGPADSLAGLARILTAPSQLTRDYFKLGGLGGAYLNVALMGLAYTALHAFTGTALNGMTFIAFFLPLGFWLLRPQYSEHLAWLFRRLALQQSRPTGV